MRKKRRRTSQNALDHSVTTAALAILLLAVITFNCTAGGYLSPAAAADSGSASEGVPERAETGAGLNNNNEQAVLDSNLLWAEAPGITTSPRPSSRSSSLISLNVADANLLDVLSMLAYKLDVNIIYLEEPVKITVKTENLTPLDTLQVILQKEGLDYVQVGRNYVVGQRERLQQDFANRLLLSRFNLKYVTAAAMEGYLNTIGVDVNSLTVDSNKRSLWVKGTPMAMGEVRELVNALDIKENESIADGELFFVRYNLSYVAATEMKNYLEEIGVPVLIITVEGNQKALWLQGITAALNEARELIKALDIEENQSIAAGEPYLARFDLQYVAADTMKEYLSQLMGLPIKSLTVESNQKAIWIHGIPAALSEAREMIRALDIKENEALADGEAFFVRIGLVYINATAMADYLNKLQVPVDNILTIEANPKAIWLQGTSLAINKARELINALDIKENAALTDGEEFFIRINLNYVAASVMKGYLTALGIPGQGILVVDANPKAIWIQGTSRAINRANELVRALDILENQSLAEGEPTLARFNLNYVSAEDMAGHLSGLGVQVRSITVDANQKIIWIRGTPGEISRAGELIMNLDVPENATIPVEGNYISGEFLEFISADDIKRYLIEMGVNPQSLLVAEENQKQIWVRGTPAIINEVKQLISALDVKANADFAFGGTRTIRMPVAYANNEVADGELRNLIELLSVLLDGLRSGEPGWITWDHPGAVPSLLMDDWADKYRVIDRFFIRLKVSPNYSVGETPLHYLIAEGTPDNIELVNKMIQAITETPQSPFSTITAPLATVEGTMFIEETPMGGANDNQSYSPPPNPTTYYNVTARAVPAEAGTISGARQYARGGTATLTVTPAEGYTFVRWIENGAELATSRTYSFTVYRERFIEAVFVSSAPAAGE